MSANFESGFFVSKPAWHNQGIVIETAPSIEQGIELAGLNWGVEEVPVFVEGNALEDRKALVRSTDRKVLAVVGSRYHAVQNADAFSWFDFLLHEGDAKLETAGSLAEGKRVFILAKLAESAEVVKNDPVESYILLSNAHDGRMGLWITFTPIRVVCENTLNCALADRHAKQVIGRALRFNHTSGVEEQMRLAKDVVDVSRRTFDSTVGIYTAMAKKKLNEKAFESYATSVLSGWAYKKEDETTNEAIAENAEEERQAKLRAMPLLKEFYAVGRGQDNPKVRGTVWAGYNAFTEWLDYARGPEGGRLDSAWFGTGSRIRKKAFDEAKKLIAVA